METVSTQTHGISSVCNRLSEKILKVCHRVEGIRGKKLEMSAMMLYAVMHLAMAVFHEPWYDEAVSWQIARCASIWEILMEIPHYEGHPPLWHLILVPFAKLGAPYELSLTFVSLVFAGSAVALIIWKSPFPRIIRLLLPFTYFFFYQYGVISRPYCVMMLAFILLAMCYHGRNIRPGRYVLSLMLLCLTSAYGIVIAGGLAIVWVWEIWNKHKLVSFAKTFFKDKRIWLLTLLLAFALLLIVNIIPREDTLAVHLYSRNSVFVCLIYMLFGSVTDIFLTKIYSAYCVLKQMPVDSITMMLALFLGSLLWFAVILWGRRKGITKLLLIPYGMYAIFAAMVYLSPHHLGIGLLLFVFWFWVSCETADREIDLGLQPQDVKLISEASVVFLALSMVISLSWNISSCIGDVVSTYYVGREEATFISEHNLDEYEIMAEWSVSYDQEGNVVSMMPDYCMEVTSVLPYFDHNIFFNFNYGDDRLSYARHRIASEEEKKKTIIEWSNHIPDVLFMNPELEIVYGDSVTIADYTLVYSRVYGKIWKGDRYYGFSDIYVRNELAQELGLESVQPAYPHILDLYMKLGMIEKEEYEKWVNR